MRVLLVSRELAGFYGGGIGSYAFEMSRLFAARGHETHLLTAEHEGLRDRAATLLPGVHIHTVNLNEGRASLDAYPTFPMRYATAVYERTLALSRAQPFDYIEFPDYHAEGYFAVSAQRTLHAFPGTTLAVRLHSSSYICREADAELRLDTEMATIEHMERSAIAGADLLLAPGQRILDRAPAPLPDHQQRREVIPIPLDADRLLREFGGPKTSQSLPDTPTILFFGKLQYLKGPQDLVDAAMILLREGTRARFRFIGNDSPTAPFNRSMLEHLKRRIPPELATAFTFEPAIPRNQLGRAIRDAAMCIFPSRWESFPMVCLEAMTLSAPVIASDIGGLAEIIETNTSGLLIPPANPQALSAAIKQLLTNHPLREKLAQNAPQRVRTLCNPDHILASLTTQITDHKSQSTQPSAARSTQHAAPHPSNPQSQIPNPKSPAVSILIPFYNLAPYLPETLNAARAQTFRDYEILIIDDGSTDPAARALLDQLPPDIRLIRKPNGGLGSARNAGLRGARAPWILPLDADDLLEPDTLEKLLAAAERNPTAAYISPLVRYFNDPLTSAPTNNGDAHAAENNGAWIPLGLAPDLLPILNIGGAASGSLIRRDHALAVNGWDESMPAYEDWEFWCRLHAAGRRGVILPDFLLRYRVRAASMFRTEVSRHLALHSYILQRHPELINERTARILASRTIPPDAEAAARALIAENIRYRLADRLNEALKKSGLQRALKSLTQRTIRP